jgi:predicted DNA-binding protein (MmcQ/YjbR family)
MSEVVLEQLRMICMSLPCATEKLSHGEPTWFVDGKKSFAMFCNFHHGLRLGVWCAAPVGAQEMLIATDSDKFYRPPYVGPRGWIGVNLDIENDWDEVADILREAYRHVAPSKYLRMLEG